AGETAGGRDNITLIHADVLRKKNELNPEVLDTLEAIRRESGCPRLKLVANLPYAVATPVLANFLVLGTPFERMVVTLQWGIAQPLIASPGTKDYGSLAVMVQSLADVELMRRLPPAVFWPRPQVASAIVCIRPSALKRGKIGDVVGFRNFLRDLYVHR